MVKQGFGYSTLCYPLVKHIPFHPGTTFQSSWVTNSKDSHRNSYLENLGHKTDKVNYENAD